MRLAVRVTLPARLVELAGNSVAGLAPPSSATRGQKPEPKPRYYMVRGRAQLAPPKAKGDASTTVATTTTDDGSSVAENQTIVTDGGSLSGPADLAAAAALPEVDEPPPPEPSLDSLDYLAAASAPPLPSQRAMPTTLGRLVRGRGGADPANTAALRRAAQPLPRGMKGWREAPSAEAALQERQRRMVEALERKLCPSSAPREAPRGAPGVRSGRM